MISKYLILSVFCFYFLSSVNAKENKYPIADIPKELKENARSVVRLDQKVFEAQSLNKGSLNATIAITVLNKNGLEDAIFRMGYNKFTKISGIKGRIFDANGDLVKKISSDKIMDFSAISGIYEDTRVKMIDPEYLNYPFTVEYSFEISFDGLYSYPNWFPQSDYHVSVQKSMYTAVIPKGISFRYKEYQIPGKVTITEGAQNTIYNWEANNLKAFEPEPFSVSPLEIFPHVSAVPADFEFGGYKGNLSSWNNIGKWANSLINGNDQLPEETVKYLQNLVSNSTDDFDKIRKVYEYMQGRTRFVSIQVGIGGLKPFDASTVHRLAYGDCKALSNYMKVLLKTVGIESKNCWVNAGGSAQKIDTEFPSDQFNHVILCVPLKSDTLWLECTNQRNPCGFLGDFTDDRDVLLVDGDNSRIVHTRAYQMNDNKESRISMVQLEKDGTGTAVVKTLYKGLNYDRMAPVYWADDKDKKNMISERIKFPGFQLVSFKYKENKEIIPSFEEELKINFENDLATMGSRRFLTLNFANTVENTPGNVRSRKTDVLVRRPFIDVDTIIYRLPETLKPESIPGPVTIKTQFGEYQASVEYKENQLIYFRTFQMNKGRYPASSYADFVDFFDKISVADNMKCALIEK